MTGIWRELLLVFIVLSAMGSGARAETRIVTWNIANLHDRLGEPLRDGAVVRAAQDITRLRAVEAAIGAHVYALQEINGPDAARLIFADSDFELCVSSRFQDDLDRGFTKRDLTGERRTDRIYAVIAIRRGHFDSAACREIEGLGVTHFEQGQPRVKCAAASRSSSPAEMRAWWWRRSI